MVYGNKFGSVDFLSDKFLKSLNPSKKEIGCKISGGSDTALLTYILAKEISERKLNFIIRPLTILDVPDRGIVSQMIINEIKLAFPDVHFEPLRIELDRKENIKWHLIQKDMYDKHDIAFFTNGVNLAPPVGIVTKNAARIMNKSAPRNIDDLTQFGIQDAVEYMPFKHTDKRWTAQAYNDLNIMDNIFPLTRSCLGTAEDTNFYEKPCKKCYWCKEKYWAFGSYDKVNYV